MKSKLFTYLFFILLFGCNAQEPVILQKRLVTEFPEFYYSDVENKTWKRPYSYLDSIAIYEIDYLSDGLLVKGYLTEPKKSGKYPAVIFNRGGNQNFASLDLQMIIYNIGKLTHEGYVVIASQYRGNSGGQGNDEFGGSDVLNLIPILDQMPNVEPEKIGMYGWSRGGMMTYLALKNTNRIKAAVIGGAPSDLENLIVDRPEMENVFKNLVPNYSNNKSEALEKRSVVNWTDQLPKTTPILLMHGTADWRVKPDQSLKLALELEKNKVPFRLIMFEGGDHGISEHKVEVKQQTIAWFHRFLRDGEALPQMEYHGR